MTWPRVRIFFAIIGMISTAIFAWDQIGWLLNEFMTFADWLKSMVA